MEDQIGSLGLVLNALVLFTTRYMDAAITKLRAEGRVQERVPSALVSHRAFCRSTYGGGADAAPALTYISVGRYGLRRARVRYPRRSRAPRIVELLANGEQTSGAITDVIRAEFAISQHLRVLRDSGFASVRAEGARRLYVEPAPLSEVDAWLDRFRRSWEQRLDAPGQWGTHPAGRVRHRYGQN